MHLHVRPLNESVKCNESKKKHHTTTAITNTQTACFNEHEKKVNYLLYSLNGSKQKHTSSKKLATTNTETGKKTKQQKKFLLAQYLFLSLSLSSDCFKCFNVIRLWVHSSGTECKLFLRKWVRKCAVWGSLNVNLNAV